MDAIVKCFCLAVFKEDHSCAEDNSRFFIRLFYQPSHQLWQLQTRSSLACFHYILCKLWHLISLREMGFERWGIRVAKSSSPQCLIYCTCVAGCEKCFYVSCPPLHSDVFFIYCTGQQILTCFFFFFFIYLVKKPLGFF